MNECSGLLLACVASVPVRGERGPREGVFRVRAARKMGRSKKVEGGGRGGEGVPFAPPPLSFHLFAPSHFSRGSNAKDSFRTGTLATHAILLLSPIEPRG